MGACCCCSKKRIPGQRASEESVPLSSQLGSAAAVSTGLLVDTNLDTSIPDTYIPPPFPLPFDVVLGHPQTPPAGQEIVGKHTGAQTTESDSIPEKVGDIRDDLEDTDCTVETNSVVDSAKDSEVEHAKSINPIVSAIVEEEDVCPICLEEYDAENPKTFTKCEHHFHLACILAWRERSEACPVCDQEMIFNPPIN